MEGERDTIQQGKIIIGIMTLPQLKTGIVATIIFGVTVSFSLQLSGYTNPVFRFGLFAFGLAPLDGFRFAGEGSCDGIVLLVTNKVK
ncbi:hypothetical protein V6N13_088085 [Hibiscus sabdariffa]|uniref:Uncharacterized protein n=1 Tax=Hibiscus sabdariffa TaxID=183260 RepID=A0ABR2FZ49_9ROSI